MISIKANRFISNSAELEGGAIKFYNDIPILEDSNVFINNQAQYGSNIATYPIRMILNFYNKANFSSKFHNESFLFLNGFDNKTMVLENISSGNSFPYVIVTKIMDYSGKIVKLDNAYK